MSPITSQHLRLVPATADLIAMELADHPRLQSALACRVDSDWPPEEVRDVLPMFEATLRDRPGEVGYHAWFWVTRADPVLVGSGGFKGPPDHSGMIEIGYGTLARYRRRGFAAEAVSALTAFALELPEVKTVEAECRPDNLGSLGVLRRSGFVEVGPGSEAGTRRFRRAT